MTEKSVIPEELGQFAKNLSEIMEKYIIYKTQNASVTGFATWLYEQVNKPMV